jgi:nitroimidazol reductase NimA-like FMN-containing flavoprotein (pyridoxamine 5'-phosphate oxidase superfamily)
MEYPTPDSLAKDILRDALTMTLAVADDEGPWAAPVVFINPENYDICWISLPTTRHSLALARSPRAALSIVASDSTTAERALQISARVEKMDGPNLAWEQMLEGKRGLALPQNAGDILDEGYEWYRARPEAVYLIHLERYGFDRKRVV